MSSQKKEFKDSQEQELKDSQEQEVKETKELQKQGFKEWLKSKKIIHKSAGEILTSDKLLTGFISLDLATEGGIPLYKVTEIFGDKSMGKTVLALNIVKNALAEQMSVLYVDAENGLSGSKVIKNLGLESIEIVIPTDLEQMGEVVINGVPNYDLIVVDSLMSLPPVLEYEGGMDKVQQAQAARVLGKFFRILTTTLIKHNCTIVILNQIRESIGGGYGQQYVLPGGRAQDFASSIQIYLKSGTYDEIKDSSEDNIKKPDEGKSFNVKRTVFDIVKSRVSTPRRTGEIYIVVKRFKDYKVGEVYNAGIIRAYFRNKFISLDWFPQYKTQEECIKAVRDYIDYKAFIKVLLEKEELEKSNESREESC